MATFEVWPELQVTVVIADAVLPPMLDSNANRPLALAPTSHVRVTVAGLPLAYAPSAKSGYSHRCRQPSREPKPYDSSCHYAHGSIPPFFPPGHRAQSLEANHLTTACPIPSLDRRRGAQGDGCS
jgi:hypothetical protein